MMLLLVQEIFNLQLILKFYVKVFSLLSKLHGDINTLALFKGLVELVVVIGIDGFDEIVLMTLDLFLDYEGSANRSFRGFTIPVFIDKLYDRALFAEELVALTAIIPDIFEIKLGFAFWIFTILGLCCF